MTPTYKVTRQRLQRLRHSHVRHVVRTVSAHGSVFVESTIAYAGDASFEEACKRANTKILNLKLKEAHVAVACEPRNFRSSLYEGNYGGYPFASPGDSMIGDLVNEIIKLRIACVRAGMKVEPE